LKYHVSQDMDLHIVMHYLSKYVDKT